MPIFVPGGPDIPIEVLNDLDDERLILFCGAGISTDTGLPDFKGLVEVLEGALITPGQDRYHVLRTDPEHPLPLDKRLRLLESQLTDSRLMRKQVVRELTTKTDDDKLALHRAILTLSKLKSGGIRLVTTNFDDRFELAEPTLSRIDAKIDAAPKLPVPKSHAWETLVHLHGRITGPNDEGRDLILTSADFGRAYLTERWASRFITELFRSFNVVFIGYSLDDPVLAYMMDAFAAELALGGSFGRAYAFASFDGSLAHKKRVEMEWSAKEVIPIPYDASGDDHSLLRDTLIHLADRKNDPLTYRANDVVRAIDKLPTGPDDPDVKRALWALGDKTAKTARALADIPPMTNPTDYPKFIAWVDIFYDAGLLERPSPLPRHGGFVDPHPAPLVGGSWIIQKPPEVNDITRFLGIWLAKHVHVPLLIQWVVSKGAALHPTMRDLLIKQIAQNSGSIPENICRVWHLILHDSERRDIELLYFNERAKSGKTKDERLLLERSLIASLSPRLLFRLPIDLSELIGDDETDDEDENSSISPLVRVEIEIGKEWGGDSLYLIKSAVKKLNADDPDWLGRYASEITGLLREALELQTYLSLATDKEDTSYIERPSIYDHEQNKNFHAWTYYLTLARDAHAALARTAPESALLLLQIWRSQPYPAFKRLLLHAATEEAVT